MKIFYDIKRKMAKVLFFMLMVANGMANGGTTKEIKQLLNKDYKMIITNGKRRVLILSF